jgi:hypothetical protein
MANISIDELQKLTAYLEVCNSEGRVAELPAEWARLLSFVLDIARDASPTEELEPTEYLE